MTDRGHLFSLKEAARACEVSAQTIRRRQKAGVFPNAEKIAIDGVETWQIPLGDLLAAGFSPTSSGRPAPGSEPAPAATTPPPLRQADTDQLIELREQLAAAELRAREAELLLVVEQERTAAEKRRVADVERLVTALEGQVRMLEAGPIPTAPVEAPTPPRRRWRDWFTD